MLQVTLGLRAVVVIAGVIIASVEWEGDKGVEVGVGVGIGVVVGVVGVTLGSTVGKFTDNTSVLFTFVSKHLKYLEVQNNTWKLATVLSTHMVYLH